MSQKVHPFHLRSQRRPIPTQKHKVRNTQPDNKVMQPRLFLWPEICYSEPKKRKWGSSYYSRTLHENKLITEYCQGLFRSFGCYQKSCTVERSQHSTYQKIHITSHVLRTPSSRIYDGSVPTQGTHSVGKIRSPKERFLQQGLQQQWLPWIILKQLTSIITDHQLERNATKSLSTQDKKGSKSEGSLDTQGTQLTSQALPSKIANLQGMHLSKQALDLLPLVSSINGDWNDLIHEQTELSRLGNFFSHWNNWVEGTQSIDIGTHNPSSTSSSDGEATVWWDKQSWSAWWDPSLTESCVPLSSMHDKISDHSDIRTQSEVSYMLQARNYQPFSSMSNPSVYPNDKVCAHRIKFIFTIKPVESLVISPQIVADYIADKIEQSIPIQSLYQDIQQYFSTYESSTPEGSGEETRGKILGYRLLCSGRLQKTKFSKPAEMAESLSFQNGVLPLNSIGKDIQYGASSTTNAYGSCGIKVWIHYDMGTI